jgi:membrane protein implicated in regulation of membrane protease activity
MKNPVFLYFLIRLGLFAVVLAIMLGLIQDWMLAAVFAAVISFALSIIFLRKQRDAMSTHLYQRSQQRRDGLTKPGTKDVENDLLDGKGN